MTFDFELWFTGLCLFVVEGPKETPDKLTALLFETGAHAAQPAEHGHGGNGSEHPAPGPADPAHPMTEHFPLLSYPVRNLTVRSTGTHTLVPGPDGLPIGTRRLTNGGNPITVGLANGQGRRAGTWRPRDLDPLDLRQPRTEVDEAWLDWLLNVRLVLAGDELEDFAHLKAIPIEIDHGTLEASHVARGLTGDYLIWRFEDENGAYDLKDSMALAGMSVLRMKGLETPVQIRLPEGLVELAPARADAREARDHLVVRASVTNLPNHDIPEAERPQHLRMYFDLMARPNRTHKFRLPVVDDQVDTPSSGLCPPGTHI